MELEDNYGVSVSEEQAAKIKTVGDAVAFVLEHAPGYSPVPLAELIQRASRELREQALTHATWTEERTDSYERLAYLGDSVLALAVAADLIERYPEVAAGASPRSTTRRSAGCPVPRSAVARRAEMLREAPPDDELAIPAEILLGGAGGPARGDRGADRSAAPSLAFGFDSDGGVRGHRLRGADRRRRPVSP